MVISTSTDQADGWKSRGLGVEKWGLPGLKVGDRRTESFLCALKEKHLVTEETKQTR